MRLLRNDTTALSELRLPPSALMRTLPEMVHAAVLEIEAAGDARLGGLDAHVALA